MTISELFSTVDVGRYYTVENFQNVPRYVGKIV